MYEDGQYLKNNPTWHEQDSPYKAKWIASLLARRKIVPQTVVEVGCGTAGILRSLAELYPETLLQGWDVSPQAIELAKSRPHPRVDVRLADFAEATETWDLLLAIDVLEHLENPAAFLRQARERARFAAIHLPLDLSIQTVLRGSPLTDRRRSLGHIHMFTSDLARELLTENGWEILETNYTGGALELPVAAGFANLVKNWSLRLPRRILFALAPDLAVRVLGGWSILLLCRPKPLEG